MLLIGVYHSVCYLCLKLSAYYICHIRRCCRHLPECSICSRKLSPQVLSGECYYKTPACQHLRPRVFCPITRTSPVTAVDSRTKLDTKRPLRRVSGASRGPSRGRELSPGFKEANIVQSPSRNYLKVLYLMRLPVGGWMLRGPGWGKPG